MASHCYLHCAASETIPPGHAHGLKVRDYHTWPEVSVQGDEPEEVQEGLQENVHVANAGELPDIFHVANASAGGTTPRLSW